MSTPGHFSALAAQRRTVHKYQKSDVDHELIIAALRTALLAPNHRHTAPWHFVVVGRETRAKMAARVFALKKQKNADVGEEQRLAGLESFLNPAGLVVFAQKRAESEFQRREDYATLCCSIQNFTLSLAEHHIGTKWSTTTYITDPEMYRLLEMPETEFEIVGFVWLGHAAGPLGTQQRPFLSNAMRVLP